MNRFLITPEEAVKISEGTNDIKDAMFATVVYNKFLLMAENDPVLSDCKEATNQFFALAAVYRAGYVQAKREIIKEAQRNGRGKTLSARKKAV